MARLLKHLSEDNTPPPHGVVLLPVVSHDFGEQRAASRSRLQARNSVPKNSLELRHNLLGEQAQRLLEIAR
jgi:hypothetical protein